METNRWELRVKKKKSWNKNLLENRIKRILDHDEYNKANKVSDFFFEL